MVLFIVRAQPIKRREIKMEESTNNQAISNTAVIEEPVTKWQYTTLLALTIMASLVSFVVVMIEANTR